MQVALSNIMLIGVNAVIVACEKDSFALTLVFRFYNKSLGFAFVKLFSELFHVTWKDPSIRKELEIVGKVLLHRKQILR
jgi:hypothetical protein